MCQETDESEDTERQTERMREREGRREVVRVSVDVFLDWTCTINARQKECYVASDKRRIPWTRTESQDS